MTQVKGWEEARSVAADLLNDVTNVEVTGSVYISLSCVVVITPDAHREWSNPSVDAV
jgi:hypothetical protein